MSNAMPYGSWRRSPSWWCALVATSAAIAEEAPPSIVVADGVTQPVFGYADAIRQRVWVDSTFDTDLDGVNDRIAMDIIRPRRATRGSRFR